MPQAVIVSAVRTPIGRFQGGLSPLKAPQLGAIAVKEALVRSGLAPADVEECIMGHVLQAGVGQNPARQAARGSGLKSVMLAAQAIRAGDMKTIVAGGMESMTNAPYLLPAGRAGARLGHTQLLDAMIADGLWDVYNDYHMGLTAELVADRYELTRESQDAFAAESHRRAADAAAASRFDAETCKVLVPQGKKDPITISADEGIRGDTTAASLGKLKPAFKKDGSVTAGNASQISDGAAAVVVMEEGEAKRRGLKPLARIIGYATGGMAPEWVMMAPVEAVKNLSKVTGLKADDFGVVELNEAFAVQAMAVTRECGFDPSKVNVNGGAVALGHPIGASGCRVLVTLLHAMEQRGVQRGLASLCLGGGNAVAMAVEKV
jgi:acetyl-CoA C-acetyltransferase